MTDMLVKLYEIPEVFSLIEKLENQGITIRSAMAYEKHHVVQWVLEWFGNGWASECDVSFRNTPASCFIAVEAGSIIGFACYESTCKNFFGPVGVAKKKRKMGIGKALVLSSLKAMETKGYAYAIIGAAGRPGYFTRIAGAIEIEGSWPGVYQDRLSAS